MATELWRRTGLAHSKTRAYKRSIDSARRIFERGLARGKTVVSTSWGKDSVVMCDLALTMGVTSFLHLESPYSLPGNDEIVSHFAGRDADITILSAEKTVEEYVSWYQEIGLAHERKEADHKAVVQTIKKSRGSQWCIDQGFEVQCLGMRAHEHGGRENMIKALGPLIVSRKTGLWRCMPLAYWSNEDVWAHIAANDLPYNRRIYDAETHGQTRYTIRNLGWISTDGAQKNGRIGWLRDHFRPQFDQLVAAFPHVRLLE